jgi:hypothetical protein
VLRGSISRTCFTAYPDLQAGCCLTLVDMALIRASTGSAYACIVPANIKAIHGRTAAPLLLEGPSSSTVAPCSSQPTQAAWCTPSGASQGHTPGPLPLRDVLNRRAAVATQSKTRTAKMAGEAPDSAMQMHLTRSGSAQRSVGRQHQAAQSATATHAAGQHAGSRAALAAGMLEDVELDDTCVLTTQVSNLGDAAAPAQLPQMPVQHSSAALVCSAVEAPARQRAGQGAPDISGTAPAMESLQQGTAVRASHVQHPDVRSGEAVSGDGRCATAQAIAAPGVAQRRPWAAAVRAMADTRQQQQMEQARARMPQLHGSAAVQSGAMPHHEATASAKSSAAEPSADHQAAWMGSKRSRPTAPPPSCLPGSHAAQLNNGSCLRDLRVGDILAFETASQRAQAPGCAGSQISLSDRIKAMASSQQQLSQPQQEQALAQRHCLSQSLCNLASTAGAPPKTLRLLARLNDKAQAAQSSNTVCP